MPSRNLLPALGLAALLATPLMAQQTPLPDTPVTLRVMTYNLWYGGVQVDFNQTIAVIKAADADIVGLQEPDGNTLRIAAAAGYSYVDTRRHIISRVPLFDSGVGARTQTGQTTYPMAALDSNAAHAWALVAPGRVIALSNLHLSSDPYGPAKLAEGGTVEQAIAIESETRVPEIEPLIAALDPLVKKGVPVVVTGDFNSPSHLDWTTAAIGTRPNVTAAVAWPVSQHMIDAGYTDSFRAAHPDPVARPGLTYSPGFPWPIMDPAETHDRIDFIYTAHAKVISSEVFGEPDNGDVDAAFSPWPSDHRAVVTEMEVTPIAAPALITVEPRLITEGDFYYIRTVSPNRADWAASVVPRGGDPAKDAITGVSGIKSYWHSAIRLSTLGLKPGAYDAVMLDPEGKEMTRTRFSVVAEGAHAALTIPKDKITVGEGLTVQWSGAPGLRFDWLGVYARGEPSVYNYLSFAYTGALLEGEMTLTPDLYFQALEPGAYELRLMADDNYATMAVAPFTVLP